MRRAVRMARSEVPAMMRQAWLVMRARGVEAHALDTRRHVVMVHGFMAASGVLGPLRDSVVTRLGLPVSTFGYASIGRFEDIADRLARFVEDVGVRHEHVSLVGHSLGGLLVRYYAQELDRMALVDRVVTIASPHEGTRAANALPTGLARAMRPGSDVLARLRASVDAAPPTFALLAADDHLIDPEVAVVGIGADRVRVLDDVGHNGVLYDARAHDWVVDALGGPLPV